MPAPVLAAETVASAISRWVPEHGPEPEPPDSRPSAVLALLADGPEGVELLLTRRSMNLRNHGGEISFPGGRLDHGETYEQAALREAEEEVGLPHGEVELVGRLQPLVTKVSNSWIMPIVGRIESPRELHGHAAEVDRVLWVPLAEFTSPGTFSEEWWVTPYGEWTVFFFELADETVWGATARMVHQLLMVAHGIEGPEPPSL